MKKWFVSFACALLLFSNAAHAAEIFVPSGGSIKDAVARALPGDEIVLEAGGIYTEYFTLPDKGAGNPITIRTSALLPDRRISPGDRHLLPSIGSGVGMAPVTITGSNWRLVGLAFRANSNGEGDIIDVRGAAANIVIDRILIEGGASGQKRGVAMNGGGAITVTRSHISNMWKLGQESQGLAGWNCPGPFTIRDNFIEAASENILFGGADSSSEARMPADILVEGNHLSKNVAWKGTSGRAVKNIFEVKAGRRVVVRNNLMEHNWVDGQSGWAVVLTPRNQDGRAPWTVVEDVLFENNIVRHTVGGINVSGHDDLAPSGRTRRITFRNNLFVTDRDWLQAGGEIGELTLDHNTVMNGGTLIKLYVGDIHEGSYKRKADYAIAQLVVLNSLMQHGANGYGIWGEASGFGIVALNYHTLTYDVRRNVIAGENGWGVPYPADTLQPTYLEHQAHFTLPDYLLVAGSSYRGAALDGQDLGRVVGSDGVSPTTAPSETAPNVPPTVQLTSPAGGSTFTAPATIRLTASAADTDGVVARVNFYSGSTLIGSDVAAPYELAWTASPGTYVLTAIALDNAGASAKSAAATITVLPAAALSAPWTAQDIGAVGVAGSASFADGLFTIQASGVDIWGTADGLHYVWQRVSGDVDIVARVLSVEHVHAWTKAGVMIRETLDAGSTHGLMLVSPGKGLAFQRRVTAGGLSTNTSAGAGTAPAWVKIERRGNTISGYRSPDGITWTLVGSDQFTMGADVYVGLALTSHDNAKLATATLDAVRVNGTSASNPEPEPEPEPVPVAIATASVPEGRVGQVYSAMLSATGGGGTYTWSLEAGALPAGLSLEAQTGTITGTPQATGTAAFTIRATDADDAGNHSSVSLSLTVSAPAVALVTASLPDGRATVAYSAALAATGGSGTYVWSVSAGSLPAGVLLDATTGMLTGTPQGAGTFAFTARVADALDGTNLATRTLSIAVSPAVTVATASLPDGMRKKAYSATLQAANAIGAVSWQVQGGSLPPGLNLNATTGVISGTPQKAGTFSIPVRVTDSNTTGTRVLSITVR